MYVHSTSLYLLQKEKRKRAKLLLSPFLWLEEAGDEDFEADDDEDCAAEDARFA